MGKEILVTDAQRKETEKHVAKCLASGWGQTKNFRPPSNAAFPSYLITNHNLSLPPVHHPSTSHPFPFSISVHSGGGVQSPSHVQLFATPWTAAGQASLSLTISRRLPKFMSIESVMPSNHLILCHPLLLLLSILTSIRVISNESAVHISGQSTGASASFLPKSIQG